ncbi:MAG: cysteine hydrolase [Clostridia bacterium]|jgi:nicotinamidase-related amidase|nr:cysteine hydrolase [Clostridia bacterium]
MKLLVVVDYQNDFVDGSLGFPGAEKLEKPILNKIQQYLIDGGEVVFTLDTHASNYLDTEEGKYLPVPHCIKGTKGHKLYGNVARISKFASAIFEKGTFGCEALGEYILDGKYETIELCGLVSNICVLSNAVIAKTAAPYAHIIVDARCTSCADPELNEKALDVMQSLQIEITGRGAKK